MKKNILQIMKMRRLVMIMLMCGSFAFGINGAMSHMSTSYALRPAEQSTPSLLSADQGSLDEVIGGSSNTSFDSRGSGTSSTKSESKFLKDMPSTYAFSKTVFSDLLAGMEIDAEKLGWDKEDSSVKAVMDEITRLFEGKKPEIFLKVDEFDGKHLPKVAIVVGEKEYFINPRLDETDLHVENIFLGNRKSRAEWDFFNNFFDCVSEISDLESLKKFFDIDDDFLNAYVRMNVIISECERRIAQQRTDDKNCEAIVKGRKISTSTPECKYSKAEDFSLEVEITNIVEVFALAVKDLINDKPIIFQREIGLTCRKLRSIAINHPEILDSKKVEDAINNIIKLKKRNPKIKKLLSPNCLLNKLPLSPQVSIKHYGINWDARFNRLNDLNAAYKKVYDGFLDAKRLIDAREYDKAKAKLDEVKNKYNKDFEYLYQECVALVGMLRYKVLTSKFDEIYYRLSEEIIWDSNVSNLVNITRRCFDELDSVIDCGELLFTIDCYLMRLNEFYPLGAVYFTEPTFNEIEEAIKFFEKIRTDILEGKDSDWILRHIKVREKSKEREKEEEEKKCRQRDVMSKHNEASKDKAKIKKIAEKKQMKLRDCCWQQFEALLYHLK